MDDLLLGCSSVRDDTTLRNINTNKEQQVAALQGLKLISAKRQVQTNPLLYRRSKLVSRIDEQILLAQAAIEQRTYTKSRARSVKDEHGFRSTIQTQVRVKQWWFDNNGKLALTIRYGSRVIALSPKSNAVECATLKDVVAALQVIRAAVEGGELDAQITQASERLREGFKE
ncbi:MAG: hypothetical protein EBZ84_12765 [Betaproteobacteria bacterium]|nr:hypothetical protein [Betaproteobacteria bacterium]